MNQQVTNSIYFNYQLLKYMGMCEDIVLTLRNWLAVGNNSTLNHFCKSYPVKVS